MREIDIYIRFGAGLLFWIIAIGVGIYVGIYVCLYGGIMDAINAFTEPMNVSAGVWAIIKVIFFEVCGILAGIIPAMIGTALLSDD